MASVCGRFFQVCKKKLTEFFILRRLIAYGVSRFWSFLLHQLLEDRVWFRKLILPTKNAIDFFPLPHVFLALSQCGKFQPNHSVDLSSFRPILWTLDRNLYVDNGILFHLRLQPLYRLEITWRNASYMFERKISMLECMQISPHWFQMACPMNMEGNPMAACIYQLHLVLDLVLN